MIRCSWTLSRVVPRRNLASYRKRPDHHLKVHTQFGRLGGVRLLATSGSGKLPSHQFINMPALSPTMTQGNIGAWKKKEGDAIQPGDVLVEIETDKATMEFECQEEGFLAKILVPEGAKDWEVGKPLAILTEIKGDVAAFKDFKVPSSGPKEESKDVPTAPAQSAAAPIAKLTAPNSRPAQPISADSTGEKVLASPVAKMLAKDHGVSLNGISGSGPNNRILKHDVLDALESKPAMTQSRQTGAAFVDIPLTNMRKIIAQRLTESKQTIPHYYLTSEICMDRVLQVRVQMNEKREKADKVSVNDFIIKAAALSMRHVPEVNSAWHGAYIRQHNNVDISVAVATNAGLITPIVKDANVKGLGEIAAEVKSLAGLAKQNKLKSEQFQGGTFTISNLGMYGSVTNFTAIINPPQSCILAVGATRSRAGSLLEEDQIMEVTMSCDHRVVDGAIGARWLGWFKKYLEEPALMLL